MTLDHEQLAELAFGEVDRVRQLAHRLSRHAQLAEDLVQETFLRVIRFHGTFELHEYGIVPWLTRILHGVYINYLRHERRQPAALGDDDRLEGVDRPAAFVGGDDPHGFQGMDERLVDAIHSLKASYREPLLLWAVHDMNYAEIASVLDVPIGTVMSRLHRARKQLRERLGDSVSMATSEHQTGDRRNGALWAN